MTTCPITGQPAAIVYDDVHKSFGEHQVLRGLSLVIPKGLITVIIGRSGSGKSVTLKHVMGLLRPTTGRIFVGDDELTKMPERKLRRIRNRFGVVFQHAALFDSMNVFENVAFPLREHTRLREAAIREKVDGLLAKVGLSEAGKKFPSELSGGMRKRVGLARALVRDPEYLLYDEPTTGLDPILAAAMDELIVHTQGAHDGLTSVVISHDMRAVLHIADKVAFLVDGVVYLEGTVETFQSSTDALIQQFLTGSLRGPMQV